MLKNRIFLVSTLMIIFSTISIGILSFKVLPTGKNFLAMTMLQSNYKLLEEVLNSIEEEIVKKDEILYKLSKVKNLSELYKLIRNTKPLKLKGIFILSSNGDILFEKKNSDDIFITHEIKEKLLRKKIPLNTIFHLHINDKNTYRFFSAIKFRMKKKVLLIAFEYDIKEYIKFLKKFFKKFDQNYYICIRDYENNIILGNPFNISKKYFVERRFPNTFYKWLIQMAPKNYRELEKEEKNKKLFTFFSISINLTLILLAWVLIFYNRKEEQKLAKEQEQFFWNISHELKTPISLIKMYSEMLEINVAQDPEKIRDYLKIIRNEAEKTALLVNNILDISNIKKKIGELYFEEVNPCEFLREIGNNYKFRFEKEGVKFSIEEMGNAKNIFIDKNTFSLVIMNLLDNSIKYNDKKEKEISIRCGQKGEYVFIEIEDNGIGIDRKDIKKIFEKFQRGSNMFVKKIRGSGIGLSLVKNIVEAHKGKIEVESIPNEGTIFRILLPLNFFEV